MKKKKIILLGLILVLLVLGVFLLRKFNKNSNENNLNYPEDVVEKKEIINKNQDYEKNISQIKVGQSLYVSDNLNLHFIYANNDPFSGDKCVISEEENIITNSCGNSIQVIKKDPNINIYESITKLIPNINDCSINFITPITNFNYGYKITPKEWIFSEDDIFTRLDGCGNYFSFFGIENEIYYNQDFSDRILISDWTGLSPSGYLEKTDDLEIPWVHTVEFF